MLRPVGQSRILGKINVIKYRVTGAYVSVCLDPQGSDVFCTQYTPSHIVLLGSTPMYVKISRSVKYFVNNIRHQISCATGANVIVC